MIDRTDLNTHVTSILEVQGWYAGDEDAMDALDSLTHEVADLIDAFLAANPVVDDGEYAA